MQIAHINIYKKKPFRLAVDEINDKIIARTLLDNRVWELLETSIVIRLLSEGQNVIDVGANIGYYTMLFAGIVGESGSVISFEPEERNFSILYANTVMNDVHNVVLEKKALSDTEGSQSLYLSGHNKGDHRLSFVPDRKKCRIETVSLDHYLSGYKGEIHFIKSDTQGHELNVLKGMTRIIEENKEHLCCLFEFSPGLLNRAENNGLASLLRFFDTHQAEVYWIKNRISHAELVLVSTEKLRELAAYMLEQEETDFSRDILVFFSGKARERYFSKMGMTGKDGSG